MPLHIPLLDTWADLAKLFQDQKTWDFIGNVGYAAAIGIGGFVVRKFGLKIRKNATAIGEITTDVLALAKENETLKTTVTQKDAEIERVSKERDQLRTDYAQQQDSYRMLDHLFELSKLQWGERERSFMQQIESRSTAPLKEIPAPKELPHDSTQHNK
jgi:hypothetical protein